MNSNAVTNNRRKLKSLPHPRKEGRNIVIQLDIDKYQRGVQELQFSVVGKLVLWRWEEIQTNMALKTKFEAVWGIKDFKVIRIQGTTYHILLKSVYNQGIVMAKGMTNIKLGIFRVSCWYPGFVSSNHNG